MHLSSFNGWCNKFTWLMHLHLSNEERVMQEIVQLVDGEPNHEPAGHLVEIWVKIALNNWLTGFVGRNRIHDEEIRLLAWDLIGSALAYTDWEALVRVLAGENITSDNLFIWTLYRCIMSAPEWQLYVGVLMQESTSLYACADGLKAWLEEQVDVWVEKPLRFQRTAPIVMLATSLIANTYQVIYWSDVARAFRTGY